MKQRKIQRPRVITKCVASHYQHPQERIVEFSFPGVDGLPGGLISLFHTTAGDLVVNLYALEGPMTIHVSADEPYETKVEVDERGKSSFKVARKPEEVQI